MKKAILIVSLFSVLGCETPMTACANGCKGGMEVFIQEPYPPGSSSYRTVCKCKGKEAQMGGDMNTMIVPENPNDESRPN